MNLVIVGYTAVFGSVSILKQKKEDLLDRFSNDYIEENISSFETIILYMDSIRNDIINHFQNNNISFFEPDKGGILAALWKFGEQEKIGFEYNLKSINIKQMSIELSDFYDINPYRLYSGAEILCLMSDDEDQDFVNKYYNDGKIDFIKCPIKIIGKTHNKKSRIRNDIETASFLIKYYQDELYKIIKK